MTDYKSMFEQAVRTLAAIDESLGIGDDGCGDPDQTLTAIDDLKAAAQRGEALALTVMCDQTSHDHNVTALRIKSEEHKCCAEDFGMSLRDYFAAKAMQGFACDPNMISSVTVVAKCAYEWADAMLAARDQQN